MPSLPVRHVFTDVDDTLTWEGRLPAEALRAMERLEATGIAVVPVTGACAGWCDQMARTWPVAAVIGENGAFVMAREGRQLRITDMQDAGTRAANRLRLERVAQRVMQDEPGLGLARDNGYRRCDLALDHAQEVAPLAADAVDRAVAAARAAGVQATASSIHINLWLGDFSKRLAVERWLHGRGRMEDSVFVGDSLNDAQMFEAFRRSVGVANVRTYLARLPVRPAVITQAPGGFGFAEWVGALLAGGSD